MNSSHLLLSDHLDRLERARLALEGLSVGDAFGEGFFGEEQAIGVRLSARTIPPPTWFYTDDTAMALCIQRCLAESGRIDQDRLAILFAEEYQREWRRGYGGTAHSILRAIGSGVSWREAAGRAFSGMGSMGNGGAMRVAPVGAYFADDIGRVIAQARASAAVTHAHAEGQAGAIAVAVAAAWAWNHRGTDGEKEEEGGADAGSRAMIEFVAAHTPEGETRTGLRRVLDIPFSREPEMVGRMVGNGNRMSSADTAPFCIWCAARHRRDYAEALWATASALGDVDTTCAIVGGIVALSAGAGSIPAEWVAAREVLPI